MKRALAISLVAHLSLIAVLSQLGQRPTTQYMRGYPRLITATLIEKPAIMQMITGQQAAVAQPPATPAVSPRGQEKRKSRQLATPALAPPPATASPARTGQAPTASALKVDAPEFLFPHYLVLVQLRIEANWQPPFSGIGQEATTVYFTITRTGEIEDVRIEKSSGSFGLDQAALRAVYSANPLPPLPGESGLQTLGVHFEFVAN